MAINSFQYGARTTAIEAASRLGLGVTETLSAARRFEAYLMATEGVPRDWPQPGTPQAQPSTGTWPKCPSCAHPEHTFGGCGHTPCDCHFQAQPSTGTWPKCPSCAHPEHYEYTECHNIHCTCAHLGKA
jgi:hypothetical protein